MISHPDWRWIIFKAKPVFLRALWTVIGNLKDFLCLSLHEVDKTFAIVFIVLRCVRLRGQMVAVADCHCTIAIFTLLSDPNAWLVPIVRAVLTTIIATLTIGVQFGFAVDMAEGGPDSWEYPTTTSSIIASVWWGNWNASMRLFTFFSSYLLVRWMQDLL